MNIFNDIRTGHLSGLLIKYKYTNIHIYNAKSNIPNSFFVICVVFGTNKFLNPQPNIIFTIYDTVAFISYSRNCKLYSM